jgi:hypothetical protein
MSWVKDLFVSKRVERNPIEVRKFTIKERTDEIEENFKFFIGCLKRIILLITFAMDVNDEYFVSDEFADLVFKKLLEELPNNLYYNGNYDYDLSIVEIVKNEVQK